MQKFKSVDDMINQLKPLPSNLARPRVKIVQDEIKGVWEATEAKE